MELNHIDLLLRKYYEGESTPEEEKLLLDYFSTESVPSYLQKEKELFLALYSKEESCIPDGLESRLSDCIDLWAKQESIPVKQKKSVYLRWAAIAACLILAVSVTLFVSHQRTIQKNAELAKLESNQEIYEQTKLALALVSNKLNAGIDQVQQTKSELDKANKILNSQFKIHNSPK